jgi:cellulose synthase/poly-beta-1,6-N-acetylglucosamine synthase-like glycosyltransferase
MTNVLMPAALAIALFWFSLMVVFYTFLGYPLLIACLGRLRRSHHVPPALVDLPAVTVILAAHNEETRITARLQNLLASDYPTAKLNIIVVSDGSTDTTADKVKSLNNPRVQLITEPQRRGKAHALNLALAAARTELIVFTDVRQTFAPDAISQLVQHFSDPKIGAVSGELMIDPAASAVGGSVDFYWKLEKFIRHAESCWDSSVGCTGAIYAIRRELFQPLPADTILDDVVIPMQIAQQGYRVAFEPAARAFDPQTLEPVREQIRKRRTLAGNYQMLFRHPAWLLPWRHRLWWQLISHKYLRLAAPFFLGLLFISNALLFAIDPYHFLFYGQLLFYTLAIGGMTFPPRKIKLLALPAGFLFLNWQAAIAFWYYLRNPNSSAWKLASQPTQTSHD